MEMHLKVPKSSKERRRSSKTLKNTESFPRPNGGPQSVQGQDAIVEDQPLHGQSLNRFQVLPSIERGRSQSSPHCPEELSQGFSGLHCPEAEVGLSLQRPPAGQAPGSGDYSDPLRGEGSDLSAGRVPSVRSSTEDGQVVLSPDTLLLAVKGPDSRRFVQRFNSSDTLLCVKASAEERFGARYGENASIETMEVPRRSFTDMSQTLLQCGIENKSVLCIFQPHDD